VRGYLNSAVARLAYRYRKRMGFTTNLFKQRETIDEVVMTNVSET
jgi:hypothetical protein